MKIHVPDEFVTVNPDGSLDINYLGEEIHVPAEKITHDWHDVAAQAAELQAEHDALRWACEQIGDPYGWRLNRDLFRR